MAGYETALRAGYGGVGEEVSWEVSSVKVDSSVAGGDRNAVAKETVARDEAVGGGAARMNEGSGGDVVEGSGASSGSTSVR